MNRTYLFKVPGGLDAYVMAPNLETARNMLKDSGVRFFVRVPYSDPLPKTGKRVER